MNTAGNIFLIQGLSAGGSHYAKPFDSTAGISEHTQIVLVGIIVILTAYVSFRVWLSLKKDKKKD